MQHFLAVFFMARNDSKGLARCQTKSEKSCDCADITANRQHKRIVYNHLHMFYIYTNSIGYLIEWAEWPPEWSESTAASYPAHSGSHSNHPVHTALLTRQDFIARIVSTSGATPAITCPNNS